MGMLVRTGWLYPVLIVAVLAGAIGLRIADPFFLQALRTIAFDTYQRLEPAVYNPDSPVRIVPIDAESLERVGPWPWPRDLMAIMLETLMRQGAAVVAFDISFADALGPDDDAFAAALAASPTVLPITMTNQPADDPVPDGKAAIAVVGDDPRPFIPAFANVVANQPAFDTAASGLGAVLQVPEDATSFRRTPLVARVGEDVLPSLAMEVLRVAQHADTYTLTASRADGWRAFIRPPGLTRIEVGDIAIPTDPDGGMWLNVRPTNPEAFIPAWTVLEEENDPRAIAGRVVLIGLTVPGLADFRDTPLESSVARVAFQGEAIEHILSGRTLTRPGEARAIEIAVVVVLGLLLAWLMPRLGLIMGVLASVVGVGLVLAGGWLAFRDLGLVLDPVWPALSIWVLAASAVLYLRHRLDMRREAIRVAFGHSLAPAVTDAVLAHPDRLVLTGETRELTLMSCEVRNFGALAGRMEARQLIDFVNRLYAPVSGAILAHRGTIARNTGDTVAAFWNAPLDDEDHAANACRAAVAAIAGIREFNASLRAEAAASGGKPAWVVVGIGLSTGNCCVGNLGTGERFDYSAIGEEVIVAARLQALSEVYGVPIVVGEATVARMADPRMLELDLIRIKGRARPIRLFTPIEAIPADPATLDQVAVAQGRLLACFRGRDWDGAEAALAECRAFGVEALVNLFSLYRTRLATVREIAPPRDWDGADAVTLK